MTQIQPQQSSPYTQTRTQKSPQKLPFGMNLRSNYSAYSHNSNPNTHHPHSNMNMEIEFGKFREESKKEVMAYLKEIQMLKEELFRRNQEVEYLNSTVVVDLKKELNDAQRDNLRNFKQNERQARQLQKLRSDNFNMQQQLQKLSKQRRTYLTKLDQLSHLKQTTRHQILQKQKILRNYTEHNKKLQKELSLTRLELQDLAEEVKDKDRRLMESQAEYKALLQRNFGMEAELRALRRDREDVGDGLRGRIGELERERDELLERIQEQQSRIAQSERQPLPQQLMLQVKSLMSQIYNLIDQKKLESKQIQKKFLASVTCLQKTLHRR